MLKRVLILAALAGGAVTLSGCVVVPTEPSYGGGYGYGQPYPAVRAAPPPVVVVPPPPHRHYYPRERRYWYR